MKHGPKVVTTAMPATTHITIFLTPLGQTKEIVAELREISRNRRTEFSHRVDAFTGYHPDKIDASDPRTQVADTAELQLA